MEKTKRITLYPKTKRVTSEDAKVVITEKLDGSNLGIGKKDGEVFVAQRNRLFFMKDYNEPSVRQLLYKGLHSWIESHKEYLEEHLNEGSVMFGEWIGMGQLKYADNLEGKKKFYMFAKANIDDDLSMVYNLFYEPDLFEYVFDGTGIPEFIGVVPIIHTQPTFPTIEELDVIYADYLEHVQRPVEGFIVQSNGIIRKYVRNKAGKLGPHKERFTNE